jgi:hypothetical protein
MIQLIDSNWHSHFSDRANERHGKVHIVSPFIKRKAVRRLVEGPHLPEIRVITRFNLADIAAGVSDLEALIWLLDRGATIRGVRGLHAKMYLFGDSHSMVTSANLTEAALTKNHEFGFISADPGIAETCHTYFDRLWKAAGPDLTRGKLDEWATMLEDAARSEAQAPPQPTLPDEGATVEIAAISVSSGFVSPHLAPGQLIAGSIAETSLFSEAAQAFVKFLGVKNDRAPATKLIYDEIVDSGCHRLCGYPASKRPRIVQTGDVMFFARMMDDRDMRIFGRAIAIRHDPAVDNASPADIADLEWLEDWPNIVRVHSGQYLAGTLENGVRLSELMEELETDSFASSQRRARNGEVGVIPSQVYGQQPAVRLSEEGLQWLNDRLEKAFRKHGILTSGEMRTLGR